jgi:hypothetical protein
MMHVKPDMNAREGAEQKIEDLDDVENGQRGSGQNL